MKYVVLTILATVLLAGCGAQPSPPTTEFATGGAEEYGPGRDGEVRTVTLPDPDGDPVTFSYEIIDDLAIFEGDMILGSAEEFAEFAEADEIELLPQGTALYESVCWKFIINLKCKKYRWPDALVPYTFQDDWGDDTVDAMMRQRIRDAMDEIEAVTALRFVPRDGQEDFVRLQNSSGCSAHVGRQRGLQRINLSTNCGKWSVVHEILHALGINHEHTRHDRDDSVQINFDNIRSGKKHNFETSGIAFDFGNYDLDSVMHYSSRAFCKKDEDDNCVGDTIVTKPPGLEIGQRDSLSTGDIITINRLYPGPAPEVTSFSPTDGATRQLNFPVTFRASATAPDFVPDCCTYTWTIDGASVTDHRDGAFAELTHTFDTVGSRTILLTVRTGTGAETRVNTTLHVVNTPPSVTITRPAAGDAHFRDVGINLRGSSFDTNEPDTRLTCDRLRWTSTVASDPFPVTGCEVDVTFSNIGPRTLTLTGTDPQGATGSASVSVTIVEPPTNLPPVVRVTSPENDAQVSIHEAIALSATATDPEGDELVEFQWTVSADGALPIEVATTQSASWTPSDTIDFSSEGTYVVVVRLNVTDSEGNTASDFVQLVFKIID